MSFLIDISKLSNWEDIKADRNGVYNGVLRCHVWTVACEVNQNDTSFEIIAKKKETLHDDNQYHWMINSKRNKASPTLVRSIFLLTSTSGKIVNDACLLQYHFLRRRHREHRSSTTRKTKRRPVTPLSPNSKEHPRENSRGTDG